MNIKQKVTDIILQQNSDAHIESEADYQLTFAQIGLDSLDSMTVILKVNKEFKIEISDDKMEELNTINSLIVEIEKQTAV
ncbi:acyl carrier protein [Psychrosphaera sp. B3R10]|uniref:Acyl carrier protein n=1 Tax=Psychrosphaera algicola TaxID=3023714 RepID=A0ABT5FB81_9GAMM|nr:MULTISPECIES: acyl carrier protein [unclassified Psychrosphaera]MBU2884057.1 acyl carrier protein [Psychrosphaera sp. I2R16]MBU2988187.1 acyl carrier protein [Psychrosphaera sp. B3R10]MDC2888294.1 acyl carrier protein [Psychrosphaera sp. G1-22]MDO6718396.1 acyl carrier protein [Psychrosphaera sp. 1_MG-2023]